MNITSFAIGMHLTNKQIDPIVSRNVLDIINRIYSVKGSHWPSETYGIASSGSI